MHTENCGLLTLTAESDLLLKEHIEKHGSEGRCKLSYWSSTERTLIPLKVEKTKVTAEEIRCAKYFTVMVDSVPHLEQIDQLMFVSCFVSADNNTVERFLRLELIHSHTGISVAESVIEGCQTLGWTCQTVGYVTIL